MSCERINKLSGSSMGLYELTDMYPNAALLYALVKKVALIICELLDGFTYCFVSRVCF